MPMRFSGYRVCGLLLILITGACCQDENVDVTGCPTNWISYREQCYRVIEKPKLSYYNAIEACEYQNSQLADLREQDYAEYISETVTFKTNDTAFWVIKDFVESGVCNLMEDKTQPFSGSTRAVFCNTIHGYICQKPAVTVEMNCPKITQNFIHFEQSFAWEDKCYYLYNDRKDWQSAWRECQKISGDLVSSFSKAVLKNLRQKLPHNNANGIWIGLYKACTGAYHWLGQENKDVLSWDSEKLTCGTLRIAKDFTLRFESTKCNQKLSYLCEVSKEKSFILPVYSECPTTWRAHGSFCYHDNPARVTWQEAENACNQMGGNLLSLHSAVESNFVKHNIYYTPFWIGIKHSDTQPLVWTDGSSLDFTKWHKDSKDQPQQCVQIKSDNMKWSFITCEEKLPYVCKRKRDVSLKSFYREKFEKNGWPLTASQSIEGPETDLSIDELENAAQATLKDDQEEDDDTQN